MIRRINSPVVRVLRQMDSVYALLYCPLRSESLTQKIKNLSVSSYRNGGFQKTEVHLKITLKI
jgi:hypothetical protein